MFFKLFLYICFVLELFNQVIIIVMTEETKQHNFELFIKKLSQLGINTDTLVSSIGDKLKNATFNISTDSGLCGDGTLIETILKTLTPFAVRLNGLYPEDVRVDQNTLVKICLLHQIAKAIRIKPSTEEWKIKKGQLYDYDSEQPSIRTGLHSLVLAQSFGIPFTAEEAEAMVINDRELTDDQARWHSSLLASIVRMANEMTYLQSMNTKKIND